MGQALQNSWDKPDAWDRPDVMNEALRALAASDSDSDAVSSGSDASVVSEASYDPAVGSGSCEAAFAALEGFRFAQRSKPMLEATRKSRKNKVESGHREYVAAISNRNTARPCEVVKFSAPRYKAITKDLHRRWHENGILSACFKPLAKAENIVVPWPGKRPLI